MYLCAPCFLLKFMIAATRVLWGMYCFTISHIIRPQMTFYKQPIHYSAGGGKYGSKSHYKQTNFLK